MLDDSLDLVNYRLAWKDTDGSSLVKVEPLPGGSIFRPVSMERTDRRLGNSTVRMNLSYDADPAVFPRRKRTTAIRLRSASQ